jgi:hypothetical protein
MTEDAPRARSIKMVLLARKTSMMTTVPKALSAPFKQCLIVVFTLAPFPQTVYSDSQNNVPLSKCWQGSYGFRRSLLLTILQSVFGEAKREN